MLHLQADQPVEGFDQVHGRFLSFSRRWRWRYSACRRTGSRNCGDVQQAAATGALDIEEIARVGIGRGCGRCLGERGILLRCAAQLQIVERVFIAFQPDDFEGVGNAGVAVLRLAFFPIGGIDDLFQTRDKNGLEILRPFRPRDIYASAPSSRFRFNDRVTCCAGSSEDNQALDAFSSVRSDVMRRKSGVSDFNRFRETEDVSYVQR